MNDILEKLIIKIRELSREVKTLPLEILSSRWKDIKISSDKFLHREITLFLEKNTDFPILSEEAETEFDCSKRDRPFWILDPLDGTLNYSRGIPISCVSLGLWQLNMPLAGIIYDFNRDEIFLGVAETLDLFYETGAWLNGEKIITSEVSSKDQAVICTGFPSWRGYDTDSLNDFVRKVQRFKKVRLFGSAAISLAWVACGRVDAYLEEDIRTWDIAAGAALVKAAGGYLKIKNNEKPNYLTVFASNGKLKDEEN